MLLAARPCGYRQAFGSDASATSFPLTLAGGEMGSANQRLRTGGGDRYRVLLLDHERHTEDMGECVSE